MKYIWNIIVWIDQGINTVFGGDPDETISSRAAKAKNKKHLWGCCLCKVLDWFEKDHCDKVIEFDEGKDAI